MRVFDESVTTESNFNKTLVDVFTPGRTLYAILYNLALIFGGVIVLAISAQVRIPLWPIPITLQTYVVTVIGLSYGWRLSGATLFLYILCGSIGLPVFSGAGSGLIWTLPSGGYIFGFLVSAVLLGYLAKSRNWDKSSIKSILAMFIGTIIIYLFGLSWLSYAVPSLDTVNKVLSAGLYPFIVGGIIKSLLAGFTLPFMWKFIKKA